MFDDDGQTKDQLVCLSVVSVKKSGKAYLYLNFNVDNKIKLEDYRVLSSHSAFKNISQLEKLATKYRMKIIFNPKYHFKSNFIEGHWWSIKCFIRQKTDQNCPTMLGLISESREYSFEKNLQDKLFQQFWRTLDVYNKGKIYNEVLQLAFRRSCKYDIASDRRTTNSNMNR